MEKTPWHLSRAVPAGFLFAILLQAGTLVWTASKTDSRIGTLEVWKAESTTNQFTKQDGDMHEYRISAVEGTANRIDEKLDKIITDVAIIKASIGAKNTANSTGISVAVDSKKKQSILKVF